jgi:CHASE3 domain sensor protein
MDIGNKTKQTSGWTLAKEIYGTFLGMLPFLVMLLLFLINVVRQLDNHDTEIKHLKEADARFETLLNQMRVESMAQRAELLSRLDKIDSRVEAVQQSVAKLTR